MIFFKNNLFRGIGFIFILVFFSCKTVQSASGAEVKISKHKKTPETIFAEKVQNLLTKNKIDEALMLFETDDEVAKSENMQYLKLSLLISKGDLKTAQSLANELEAKYPQNTDVLYAQSFLASTNNNESKKNSYLKRIIKVEPNNVLVLLQLAQDAYFKKNYKEATNYYTKVLKTEPANEEAQVGLANVLYMKGDFKKAESQLENLVKQNKKNAAAYATLARVQFEQTKVLPAIENINKSLKLDDKIETHWIEKGTYCIKAGKEQEALNAYTKALELNDKNYIAYIYRAGVNDSMGKRNAAIHDYKKVLELYPQYYFAAEGLGVIYFEKGEYDKARISFVTALEKNPGNVFYALMVTVCYYQLGNESGAKNFMRQYLPYVNRKDKETEYYLSRLFVEKVGESDVLMRISKEENQIKKYRMQFYLAKFYELILKSHANKKMYEEISFCKYPNFFEYRLVENELKKRGIAPRSK